MWRCTHRHVGSLEEDVSFPVKGIYSSVFALKENRETLRCSTLVPVDKDEEVFILKANLESVC